MLVARPPTPPLNEYVACLWYAAGNALSHHRERVLPTGTLDIVFQLGDEPIQVFGHEHDAIGKRLGRAVVAGAQSRYFVLPTSQQSQVAGIHFRPGGAARFLAAPLSEITDQHVDLEDIWGREAIELRQRLLEAASPTALSALLEQALLRRIRDPEASYPAAIRSAELFAANPSLARIRQVSDSTGCSPKRFIRMFHDAIGLTPKLYCRVKRFQALLDEIALGGRIEWAKVALDCGYYDQSHMIRDFRAFAGITPQAYRPVEAGRKNHVAIS